MDCKNISHFIAFLLILVLFFLYKESQENIRFYDICKDQEEIIIKQQQTIKNLEYYYYLYYNYSNPLNTKKNLN